jgi:hypothetical protein
VDHRQDRVCERIATDSGWSESESAARQQAIKIACEVRGVKSVVNSLEKDHSIAWILLGDWCGPDRTPKTGARNLKIAAPVS